MLQIVPLSQNVHPNNNGYVTGKPQLDYLTRDRLRERSCTASIIHEITIKISESKTLNPTP